MCLFLPEFFLFLLKDKTLHTMNIDTDSPKVHHGRNVKRLREILGIKQEVLADKLELSQQTVSKLENKEEIDEDTLQKIAVALNIPVEAIDRKSVV